MISPINFRGFSPFFWIDWMNKNLGFQFVPPLQGDLKIRGTVFFDVAGFQPGGGHLIWKVAGVFKIQPASLLKVSSLNSLKGWYNQKRRAAPVGQTKPHGTLHQPGVAEPVEAKVGTNPPVAPLQGAGETRKRVFLWCCRLSAWGQSRFVER